MPSRRFANLHGRLERNAMTFTLAILVVCSVGGIVEIAPLFALENTVEPVRGMRPYTPLELAGRAVYLREGCYGCHSQQIRPFRDEVERYGAYSLAAESAFDHPFQWGSKRTGPDLARIGGRYSDDWHRVHLINPRNVVPESIMPGYPWLRQATISAPEIESHMRGLAMVGDPYTAADFGSVGEAVKDKTELDALIAYLQDLGKYGPKEDQP